MVGILSQQLNSLKQPLQSFKWFICRTRGRKVWVCNRQPDSDYDNKASRCEGSNTNGGIAVQRMLEEQCEYDQKAFNFWTKLMNKRDKEVKEVKQELEIFQKKYLDYQKKEKIRMPNFPKVHTSLSVHFLLGRFLMLQPIRLWVWRGLFRTR